MWVSLEVIPNDNTATEHDVVASVTSEDFDALTCEPGSLGTYAAMVSSTSEFTMKHFVTAFPWLTLKTPYVFAVG